MDERLVVRKAASTEGMWVESMDEMMAATMDERTVDQKVCGLVDRTAETKADTTDASMVGH